MWSVFARHEGVCGIEVWLQSFLISELEGRELSASRSARYTIGEKASYVYWIGGWAGLKSVWTFWIEGKSRILQPLGRSSSKYTDYAVWADREWKRSLIWVKYETKSTFSLSGHYFFGE